MEAEPVGQFQFGAFARPTLVFVAAYALCISPHEAMHALVAYALGFNARLFQMWVDPEASTASATAVAAIAAAGPLFSLIEGLICLFLYRRMEGTAPSRLVLLMIALVGIYSFLGPLAAAALGGDFHVALNAVSIPHSIQTVLTVIGFIALPCWMFYMGRELIRFAPSGSSRVAAISATTLAPWFLGVVLIILLYWPLPKFLIGSTITGSAFWLFAVIGAWAAFGRAPPNAPSIGFSRADLIALVAAILLVRGLALGIHLAH
jgi:hypothetical protein